jgi:hypothetical protein
MARAAFVLLLKRFGAAFQRTWRSRHFIAIQEISPKRALHQPADKPLHSNGF